MNSPLWFRIAILAVLCLFCTLTWYGLHSFGPGQLPIVMKGSSFMPLQMIAGIFVLAIIAIAGIILHRRKAATNKQELEGPEPEDTGETPVTLTKADLETLEEKIIQLLVLHKGEQFQSEMVKVLGLPKSTVSTTLNDLHRRGIIQKVRKGRENLIRLVQENG